MWSSVPTPGSDPSTISNRAPIYLNVYDVTNVNSYLYWLGLGIFHSGIEAHGVEYAFGAHDYPTTGVFEVEPRNCPGFIFRRTITVGTTDKDPMQFRDFIEQVSLAFTGDSYHLIAKNCNHFTNDVCMKLTERSAPAWVNRLANIAAFCSCLLPESLQVTTIRHTAEYQIYEDENGEEDLLGEVDFHNQGQRLLTAPNGDVQYQMQDHFRDGTLVHMKDLV